MGGGSIYERKRDVIRTWNGCRHIAVLGRRPCCTRMLNFLRCPSLFGVIVALLFVSTAAADDLFEIVRYGDEGRTVMAEFADLNGDGRMDLLQVVVRGIPPNESRVIKVRLQNEKGEIAEKPTYSFEAPPGVAAYDLGDLRETPGTELLLLRGEDLLVLSLAEPDGPRWTLDISDGTSVGAGEVERGFSRLRMIYDDFGEEARILVPMFGRMIALSGTGALLATMNVPARANFYIPPLKGAYFGDSDIQLFFDAPRVSVGDIDGDGKADIVTANRHEIYVFLQRDGTFTSEPTRVISLGLISAQDHIRGTGGVTVQGNDFNGDGQMDLLVSHVAGSFRDASTTTTGYLNRDGDWDRENPVGVFVSTNALVGDLLVDLDGDGLPELLRSEVPMSLLEIIELLVTGEMDLRLSVYAFRDGRFSSRPMSEMKLGLPINFDTFRTAGFLPQVHIDANGDGLPDLLLGGDGDEFEVRLGGQKVPFGRSTASQDLETAGEIRSADYDGDGQADFLIFNPHVPGGELRLLRNRGLLPGSPPQLRSEN